MGRFTGLPIGWVVNFIIGLFLAFGLYMSIQEIRRVSEDFLSFISITASAKSEADLDRAAGHPANSSPSSERTSSPRQPGESGWTCESQPNGHCGQDKSSIRTAENQ